MNYKGFLDFGSNEKSRESGIFTRKSKKSNDIHEKTASSGPGRSGGLSHRATGPRHPPTGFLYEEGVGAMDRYLTTAVLIKLNIGKSSKIEEFLFSLKNLPHLSKS